MSALLGLLGGMPGRILAGLAAAGAIVLAVVLWLHEHDARLLAEQAAKVQAVAAAQQLATAKAAADQAQALADAAEKRAATLATAKTEIAHAPPPAPSCGPPAAVLRAVDALRRPGA